MGSRPGHGKRKGESKATWAKYTAHKSSYSISEKPSIRQHLRFYRVNEAIRPRHLLERTTWRRQGVMAQRDSGRQGRRIWPEAKAGIDLFRCLLFKQSFNGFGTTSHRIKRIGHKSEQSLSSQILGFDIIGLGSFSKVLDIPRVQHDLKRDFLHFNCGPSRTLFRFCRLLVHRHKTKITFLAFKYVFNNL